MLNRSPHIPEIVDESDEDFCARLDRAFDDVEARLQAVSLHRSDPYGEWPEDLRRDLERGWESILDPPDLWTLRVMAGDCALPGGCRCGECRAVEVGKRRQFRATRAVPH